MLKRGAALGCPKCEGWGGRDTIVEAQNILNPKLVAFSDEIVLLPFPQKMRRI